MLWQKLHCVENKADFTKLTTILGVQMLSGCLCVNRGLLICIVSSAAHLHFLTLTSCDISNITLNPIVSVLLYFLLFLPADADSAGIIGEFSEGA